MYDKQQLKLYIDPDVLKKFKHLAIDENRKLSEYVQALLEKEIEKQSKRYVLHKNLETERSIFFAPLSFSFWPDQ